MSRREEFVVGAGAEIEVMVDAGHVSVVAGAVDRITVELDGGDGDWEVKQIGDSVTVRSARRWRAKSARVDVVVPEGGRVVVRTAAADVRLRGRFGVTRVKTASGDVELDALTELEVATASGDVQAREVTGDVEVATISGDIRLGAVGGRVGITTTSGDVVLRRVGSDLDVHAVSGDVRVERFDGDELTARSVAGDLEVGLPSGIRVAPEIATLSGSTRLPERREEADPSVERRRVRLAFKSVSGDLTIRRVDD